MIGLNEYFEIDWTATRRRLRPLLLERVSCKALVEWAGLAEGTIPTWLKRPGRIGAEELVTIAKFLDEDLLSIIVTKGQQEDISLLEDYFNGDEIPNEDIAAVESAVQQQKRRGRPRVYNPNCTTAQHFIEKALYNEYLYRSDNYTPSKNIEEFLLYLPLIDSFELSDFIFRTIGSVCNNRSYVHEKLDWLIRNIPASDAKRYADKMYHFCLCKPNVLEVSDRVKNDPATKLKTDEYYEYTRSDNYKREFDAYYSACCRASKRFAFLSKLKMDLDDVMIDQQD